MSKKSSFAAQGTVVAVFFCFTVASSCKGNPATSIDEVPFEVYELVEGGAKNATESGVVLGEPGDQRRLIAAVFENDINAGGIENVSDRATWGMTDSTVATIENGVVTAREAGQTTLRVTHGSRTREVTVVVIPNALAKLVELWLLAGDPVVVHSVAPMVIGAMAKLENGAEIDEPPGLEWSSTNPDVASIDDTGTVTPVAEGQTDIVIADEASGLERALRLIVALPQPSPSVLTPATGGLVASSDA